MKLDELNNHPGRTALMYKCCGSKSWVQCMDEGFPFRSKIELLDHADECWNRCSNDDWMEAFSNHPRIGDIDGLKEKFAADVWAASEQQGAAGAGLEILSALKEYNDLYLEKFGFIFIICATGKTAAEMLDAIKLRIGNDSDTEQRIAAGEQRKIMHLRLDKLLS